MLNDARAPTIVGVVTTDNLKLKANGFHNDTTRMMNGVSSAKNQFQAKFRGFRDRILSTAEQLDDIGTIVDEDLYKRDILISAKKLGGFGFSCTDDRVQGGHPIAKFAGNYLMHLVGILGNPLESKPVRMYTVLAIGDICFGVPENQEKARAFGILQQLAEFLKSTEPELADLRRCAASTLVRLTADNYENQKAALDISGLQVSLKQVMREDWDEWDTNEADSLYHLLGFDRPS